MFTEIDGREIEHLDYHEMYNPSNATQSSAEEMEEQKQHSARQDQFILKNLFMKTGVTTAVDEIVQHYAQHYTSQSLNI